MGTEITLDIGPVMLTYAKNSIGIDHGSLFQESDRQRRMSPVIDYDYFKEIGEEPVEMEMAFARSLKDIIPRLELLGFTLASAKQEYSEMLKTYVSEYSEIYDSDSEEVIEYLTFDQFCEFVTRYPLNSLEREYIGSEERSIIRGRFFNDQVIKRLPWNWLADQSAYSEASYFANLIGVLHPYSLLRILSGNSANLEQEVVWQYGPLVSAGWAKSEDFVCLAKRNETFLIATEGSSDVYIIGHALKLIRPEVLDFFRFIDVEKGHPFPGTGNLLKFAEGLIKIDVQNKILFLFDNDAEGLHTYQTLGKKYMPSNMSVAILPTLAELSRFLTLGPGGESYADINGKAAAIECYLDLEQCQNERPIVTWTNYKKELGIFQGSLDNKENFTKIFLKQTCETIENENYNIRKLQQVLDCILERCRDISEKLNTPFKQIQF